MTKSQERLKRDHESLPVYTRLGQTGVSLGQTVLRGLAPDLSKKTLQPRYARFEQALANLGLQSDA